MFIFTFPVKLPTHSFSSNLMEKQDKRHTMFRLKYMYSKQIKHSRLHTDDVTRTVLLRHVNPKTETESKSRSTPCGAFHHYRLIRRGGRAVASSSSAPISNATSDCKI